MEAVTGPRSAERAAQQLAGDAVLDEGCAPRRRRQLRRYRTVTADSRPMRPLLLSIDRLTFPAFGARYGSAEPNLALELQAANGVRTRDLKLGKLALYQLSYRRTAPHITRWQAQSPHPRGE